MNMYKEEALPLITYDSQTRQYGLAPEAAKLIQSIEKPVAIISVAGLYRTGKSYLLNRIVLDRSNGFGVGPTVNPCTKGMWVWGTPIDMGKMAILIVDSEGTGALNDSDVNHDTRIFALAILLASTFVYNSVGAIDEGALESLGLVVNLTKFIKLKSKKDDPESEEYADYMPSFFWVLRDFSLQLLDNNGDQLTSHQYLERSLQEQSGFSNGVEEKNRIRRLLQTFFPERECFTLVRPVLKESQLQSLQHLDMKQLRPEFYDQAITLKKMLFSKVKPKQLHGKSLTGSMYVNLIQQYLTAINSGNVANIESSWSYVFKEECRRLSKESFDLYEKLVNENLMTKIPTSEIEIRQIEKLCKQKCLEHMNTMQDADNAAEFVQELKARMKQKFATILQINEQESQNICKTFVHREFAQLEKKLKMGEYKSYSDFQRDLRVYENFLEAKAPKVAQAKQISLDFLLRMSSEGGSILMNQMQQDRDSYKQYAEEQIQLLQSGLTQFQTESKQKVEHQGTQIKQLQQQQNELKSKHSEEIERVKTTASNQIQELSNQYNEERTNLVKQLEIFKEKSSQFEEELKNSQREQFLSSSEAKKREALLEQKVVHMSKQLEEFQQKEKQLDKNFSLSKNEFQIKLKEISQQYEEKMAVLIQSNIQVNEKLQETSDSLMQLEIKYANQEQNILGKEESNNSLVKKLQSQNSYLQEQLSQLNNSNKQLQEELLNQQANLESNLSIEQLKQEKKSLESKLLEQKQGQLKSEAVLNQQIQFLQLELEEKKNSIADIKKSHDQALNALESSSSNSTSQNQMNKQLLDLKEQHMNELRILDQTSNQQKKQLQQQIDQLNQELNENEQKCELYQQEKNKLQDALNESYNLQDELKQKIQQQMKDLDSSKYQQIRDKEQRLNQKINQLQEELSQSKQQQQLLGSQHQQNVEQQILELRNYYEMEKDVLERRIHEERLKADSKYQVLFEEQEQKQREEQQQYEEEIEQLKEELRELDINFNNQQQQYENDLELKNKSLQTLECIQLETKEQLIALQQSFQSQLDNRTQSLSIQIQQLESTLTQQQFNNQQMSKENTNLQQKQEHLEIKLAQKIEELKLIKEDLDNDKQQLQEKYEDIRRKYTATCDEYLEKKINYEKSIALSAQQNEFFAKKVEELEKQVEQSNSKYEERFKQQKQEWNQELAEKLQKLSDEKQQADLKLTTLKRTLREKETQILKLQQDLEKESGLSNEKISYLESKLRDQELQNSSESSSIAQNLKSLREQYNQLKSKSQSESEQQRFLIQSMEFEKQEMQANYEKDKTLWLGKQQFLESQKESLKQELAESMKKFESTINTLQRQRSLERNDHNQDITEMLNSIERKYQDQCRDLQEQQQRKIDELNEKIEKYEREIKQLQNKDILDQQAKFGQQFERKTAELLENEKRLHQQIEELRNERDQRINDHQEELEQEKEYWRIKQNELEERVRESDKKHSQLIFFHEKERAKWNQERDHILQQRLELQDTLQRLEKKKELLLRENEKIKNTSKSQRKYNPNSTYMGGLNASYLKNQNSDKKIAMNKEVNMSCDVSKLIQDDQNQKENSGDSTSFGSFKRYYQLMNSKQGSPSKEQ